MVATAATAYYGGGYGGYGYGSPVRLVRQLLLSGHRHLRLRQLSSPARWNDRQRRYWSQRTRYMAAPRPDDPSTRENWSGFNSNRTTGAGSTGIDRATTAASPPRQRDSSARAGRRRIRTIEVKVMTASPSWLVTVVSRSERPHFGPAPRRRLVDDLATDVQRVAGIDRLLPAQLVDPGRTEPSLLVLDDVAGDHRHRHRAGVPAARRDPPEMGLRRFLIGEMEGLRVVLAGELEHFLAGHLVGAEYRSRRRLPGLRNRSCGAHNRGPRLARGRRAG